MVVNGRSVGTQETAEAGKRGAGHTHGLRTQERKIKIVTSTNY